ncbi:g9987 [Coccomyxa elongata]
MLEFKGRTHERRFQIFFAEQHLTWDLFVCSVCWCMTPSILITFWRNNDTRSLLWYAAYMTAFVVSKGFPVVLITRHSGLYIRQRTAVALTMRLMEMCIGNAFMSYWMDFSNKAVFSEWITVACIFGNSWMSAGLWGILLPIPNRWWMVIQVIDLARILLRKTRSLDQVSGGLHHLRPLAGALGAVATKLGLAPVTEWDLLFCMWTFLEVFGSSLLPFWVCYRRQLRNRRQWRQAILKRRSDSQDGGPLLPDRDPGLDIRPTWGLYLPESLVFLAVSFVAGSNFKVLHYML